MILSVLLTACGAASSGTGSGYDLALATAPDLALPASHLIPPEGQSSMGTGGDVPVAGAVRTAGTYSYRLSYLLPDPAPYAGQGTGSHGDKYQFVAALRFFVDKTRQ